MLENMMVNTLHDATNQQGKMEGKRRRGGSIAPLLLTESTVYRYVHVHTYLAKTARFPRYSVRPYSMHCISLRSGCALVAVCSACPLGVRV